jgi:hypothetical protein
MYTHCHRNLPVVFPPHIRSHGEHTNVDGTPRPRRRGLVVRYYVTTLEGRKQSHRTGTAVDDKDSLVHEALDATINHEVL